MCCMQCDEPGFEEHVGAGALLRKHANLQHNQHLLRTPEQTLAKGQVPLRASGCADT